MLRLLEQQPALRLWAVQQLFCPATGGGFEVWRRGPLPMLHGNCGAP